MDLLFSLNRSKKKNSIFADIKLLCDDEYVEIITAFDFHYFKNIGIKKIISFSRQLTINLKTGDIKVFYCKKNDMDVIEKINKTNTFKDIQNFTYKGLINGEKTQLFWGTPYLREITKLYRVLLEIFEKHGLHVVKKEKSNVDFIFDIIVDFHLFKKGIKGHNMVYTHIIREYPRKKWLKLNDNKFLPAVLDSYGIKSKSLLGSLNKYFSETYVNNFHFRTLKFICNLFGDEYAHYVGNLPSIFFHCNTNTPNAKTFLLKNTTEKKNMLELFKNWESNYLQINPFIEQVHHLLDMRNFLEKKGYKLKFNVKNDIEFLQKYNEWYSLKTHFTRGYKLMIDYSEDLINEVEKDIIINNITYKVILLKSEDDFRLEGHRMKNCMGDQFISALNSTFFTVIGNGKRYHIQFKDGEMKQIYGKANIVVTPGEMDDVIDVLSNRLTKYYEVKTGWNKVKYNFIT